MVLFWRTSFKLLDSEDFMGTIITISGPSGSGKTTLANHFLSLGPQFRMIESVTTRLPRERDRPGEFLYIAHEEFNQMEHEDKFLWVKQVHGKRYGTLRESVNKALTDFNFSIMVITIECLPLLYSNAMENAQKIFGLYILSPGEETLRLRMNKRGDDPHEIEKRIDECRGWDAQAREINEHTPFRFIRNEGTPDEFLEEVLCGRRR